MSVEKALKALPHIFSLQPNDYSEFLPEESVNRGIQNRWLALGNRLQNATDSIGIDCRENSPSELEVELITSTVLDTLRKELVNAIVKSGLDAASVDVDALLEKSDAKASIEEKVRLTMDRNGRANTLPNGGKNHHSHGMTVKKPSNAKKETSKRSKQSYRPNATG